ncbi:sensor histidine kinase [Kitasatospora sp. NPDC052896]|uniref:sensor histidine kinase n=1 Tax=Kitasatospora sp. NPDC052896 TaxID=3364061 RepID=UPI0037C96D59
MPLEYWTRWPQEPPLDRRNSSWAGALLSAVGRLGLLGSVVWGTYAGSRHSAATAVVAAILIISAGALFYGLFVASRRHWPRAALGCIVGMLVVSWAAQQTHGVLLANVIWCAMSVIVLLRLPLTLAVPATLMALASYSTTTRDSPLGTVLTVVGLLLLGYLLRLDGEARATARLLLAQQLAAKAAEAESAALAERARIAREIHDVLAHSLSAQLVHLEAARLMLDGGADRGQIRERVVAARRMAQDGLAETRQALSALRGEFVPVGDYLVQLVRDENAVLTVEGTPRPLAAEAGLAVRRTAQEALTNVRKHASGGGCTVLLRYLPEEVELEVRNVRGPRGEVSAELAGSGSGYGLLGMRERAELLGGSLLAGPDDGGWRVLLRVPA